MCKCFCANRGSQLVERLTVLRGSGYETCWMQWRTPVHKSLVNWLLPRKQQLHPDMAEKLLTWMFLPQNRQQNKSLSLECFNGLIIVLFLERTMC